MAAYAALLSVMHIIDALRLHPQPPISLHKTQALLLTQKITFLQEFLEGYNPHLAHTTEADPFEIRIADAAYAAEDAIENHIADHLTDDGKKISPDALYEALEMVIQEMALIQKEAIDIKEAVRVPHQLHTDTTSQDSLRSYSPMTQKRSMVGAEDALLEMKDKLTSDRRDLQIIPIVGMGGSGKTTLALSIYQDLLIKEHFHICAWATISQEYNIQEMLIQVLRQLNQDVDQSMNEDALGEMLYKHLFGRKYLITLDDMWSIEAWDGVRRFLPDNKNGSRIVVTTRLSTLFPKSNSLEMKLLDEAHSCELLSKTVFGGEGCPLELDEIGKEIAESCKGLPLSIVMVGGFLAKSERTIEFWKNIQVSLTSIVNLEDGEHCLKILHMSYKQLPVCLKPCFLYMGLFPEDKRIRASKLAKLWVAEGFLKPVSGKTLEEVARTHLKDLIGRNLILIDGLDRIGNMKYCKIHDLLRDLCIREAEKERFYTTSRQGIVNGQRRIVISKNEAIEALSSMSQIRSLMLNLDKPHLPSLSNFTLIRILQSTRNKLMVFGELEKIIEDMHRLVNSRFLNFCCMGDWKLHFSVSLFWNLQTLIVQKCWGDKVTISTDFWYMPHIRHVKFYGFHLPDPPMGEDEIVLGNLHTLKTVRNFKCSKQMVKRIPNIKKLKLFYDDVGYSLSNLDCLQKLESLKCDSDLRVTEINFPRSLKKLSLDLRSSECCGDIMDKIGVLPLLQKIQLYHGRFEEGQWETKEGQFRSLGFLGLSWYENLRVWTTESSHFPCLDYLHLFDLDELEEIPSDFGEASTLRVIDMRSCRCSALFSAKRILEEQEELYGEEAALQVRVKYSWRFDEAIASMRKNEALIKSWESPKLSYHRLVERIRCDVATEDDLLKRSQSRRRRRLLLVCDIIRCRI